MAGRDGEMVPGNVTTDGAAGDDPDDHATYGLRRLSQSEARGRRCAQA